MKTKLRRFIVFTVTPFTESRDVAPFYLYDIVNFISTFKDIYHFIDKDGHEFCFPKHCSVVQETTAENL